MEGPKLTKQYPKPCILEINQKVMALTCNCIGFKHNLWYIFLQNIVIVYQNSTQYHEKKTPKIGFTSLVPSKQTPIPARLNPSGNSSHSLGRIRLLGTTQTQLFLLSPPRSTLWGRFGTDTPSVGRWRPLACRSRVNRRSTVSWPNINLQSVF